MLGNFAMPGRVSETPLKFARRAIVEEATEEMGFEQTDKVGWFSSLFVSVCKGLATTDHQKDIHMRDNLVIALHI